MERSEPSGFIKKYIYIGEAFFGVSPFNSYFSYFSYRELYKEMDL
jgi:hypothetical protein